MRRGVLMSTTAALLVAPTVVAFDSGGASEGSRLTAAIVAVVLLGLAVAATPGRLFPATAAPRVALAALAALAGWTAIARSWSPSPGGADEALELAILYLAGLGTAALLLRGRSAARAVEPVLALGGLAVCAYGLAGRLLPGLVSVTLSPRAGGRLDQPLTYWNAEGALGGMTLVLAARLAGDRSRPLWLRALAGAAMPAAGAVLYLSFSRAAIAAAAAGLLVLVVLHPVRTQLRAVLLAAAATATAVAAIAPFDSVRALAGSLGDREHHGVVTLLWLLAIAAAGAGLLLRGAAVEQPGRRLRASVRHVAAAALVLVALLPFVAAVTNRDDGGAQSFGATTSRLTEAGSNRSHYWRVALRELGDHPLKGSGAGSFEAAWLRERRIDERVRNAHSLELETAAELGLVGLAILLVLFAAVAAAGRRALAVDPVIAVGPVGALTTWLLHASVDWDWQVPALTGVAVVLAGLLLARDRAPAAPRRPPPRPRPPAAVRDPAPPDDSAALRPPPGHPRFPLLDGLRAIAALSIVVVHVSDASGFSDHRILGALATRLNVGVAIFFVLSGFLLYRPFAAARLDGRPAPGYWRYLRRRALRIVPAFWAAMLVMVMLGWILLPGGWPRYFLFGQNLSSDTVLWGIGPAWTLDIEVAFYLTLPLWALLAGRALTRGARRQRLRVELVALTVVAVAAFGVRLAVESHDPHSVWLITYPTYLGWFTGGMALALLSLRLERASVPRLWAALAQRPALAWAGAAVAYVVMAFSLNLRRGFYGDPSALQSVAGHVLYLVVAMLLVLPAILPDPGRAAGAPSRLVRAFVGHPVMAWLGLVSYGTFLWHQPLLNTLISHGFLKHAPVAPAALLLLVTAGGGIALGAASYYVVERPFLALKERRRRPTEVPAAASSAG